MLILKEEDFIGKGSERACYLHPNDKNKAVKVTYKNNKREMNDWQHLPRFYGEVETNQGEGFIIEVIRDYDGEVSKTFAHYITENGVDFHKKEIEEFKDYFLRNRIIFNYGMMPKNILLRKRSKEKTELVLIDGLGDVSHFTLPNKIPYFARRRITRRWDKFINKYIKK